jgi:hypothetical protein
MPTTQATGAAPVTGSAQLGPQIASDMKKLPSDEWAFAMDEYTSDAEADSPDRRRGIRNVLAFCGLDTDQWPEQETNDLDMAGRYPKSYNLAQYYANGVAGNLVMNWIDPKFVDKDDDSVQQLNRIKKLQRIYYSDKEWGKYKNSAVKAVHNGCIYRGVEELVIDRTSNPLGRIRFVSVKQDGIIFDPTNQTDDISRNSKRAHKEIWLSPEEMLNYYPKAEKKIKEYLASLKKVDDDIGQRSEPVKAAGPLASKNMMGNKYRCIVTYKIVMERKRVVMDTESGMVLPKTPFPEGSEEDFMAKQMYAMSKGVEIKAEKLWNMDQLVPVNYLTTFCPSLAIVLDMNKDERQLEGHLPLYCWALIMKAGKTLGVVDLALEAQRSINRREMAKDKTTDQTPWLGKSWFHGALFEDASSNAETDFVRDFNDASKPIKIPSTAPLGSQGSYFGIMQGSQIPAGLFQDEQWKITLLNLICYLPPVLQGAAGGSSESGILFGRKVIEANVVQQMPAKNLEQHENYKAEDWVITAIKLYGGQSQADKIANLNRSFKDAPESGGESFTVNTLAGVDAEGNPVIDDDISQLKRVQVIISQAKENDYLKQAKREINIAALGAIPPSQTNDMIRAAFEVSLAKSMDQSDEVEKKNVESACDLRFKLAMTTGQAMLMQLQGQMNPPAAPPGGQGGTAAPPGAGAPSGQPAPSGAAKEPLQVRPPPSEGISPETVQGQTPVSTVQRSV